MKHYEVEWTEIKQIKKDEWDESTNYTLFIEWKEASDFIKELLGEGIENIIISKRYVHETELPFLKF